MLRDRLKTSTQHVHKAVEESAPFSIGARIDESINREGAFASLWEWTQQKLQKPDRDLLKKWLQSWQHEITVAAHGT